MGILIVVLFACFFIRHVQQSDYATQKRLLLGFIIAFVFSLILNWYYCDIRQWQYGIPNSDMRNYFDAAYALHEGAPISSLSTINHAFKIGLSSFGYLLYSFFVCLVVFSPVVISTRLSLQLLYTTQIIVAILACDNIASFFSKDKKVRGRLYWMLLLNVAILQESSILMRDIWIVFFISLLLKECTKNKPSIWLLVTYLACTAILRNYTVIVTVPIFFAYGLKRKKLGIVFGLMILAFFLVGRRVISFAATLIGVTGVNMDYAFTFDLKKIIAFFLYPNPLNQIRNMLSGADYGYHAANTGDCAWIYYMLSIWNMAVLPLAAYGIIKTLAEPKHISLFPPTDKYCSAWDVRDLTLWILIAANITLLYAAAYDSMTAPRHKLMLLYSTCFLYLKGIERMNKRYDAIIAFAVLFINLLLFTIA